MRLMHVDKGAADITTVRGSTRPHSLLALRQFAAAALGIGLGACVPSVAPCRGGDCADGLVCDLGACVPAGLPPGHGPDEPPGSAPPDSEPGDPEEPAPPPVGLDAHAVRMLLEIPPSDAIRVDLHEMPVLVQLASDALRLQSLGGDVRDEEAADIGFFDLDGAPLPSEVERYDGELGALTAWVRIPFVAQQTSTRLYMAWGADGADARGAIWDDGYHGVWHLSDAPGTDGVIDDATSHGSDGEPANLSDDDALSAVAGGGLRFTHDNAHVRLALAGDAGWSPDTTIETWVRIDPEAVGVQWIATSLGADLGIDNAIFDGGPVAIFRAGFALVDCDLTQFLSGTFNLSTEDWHHVAGVIESLGEDSRVTLYIDGLACGSTEALVPSLTPEVIVGNLLASNDLDGQLDELRIARRALTPDELFAQVANVRSPATFVVAHEPERGD